MTALIDPEKRLAVLPEAIRRYADGASLHVLAADYGVSRSTLYKWIFTAMGEDEHRELVTEALVARIAEADEGLEGADSVLEVTKRREIARFARMDFERRRPALYGVKQEVRHTVAPVLHIHTAQAGEREVPVLPAPSEGE